ncbi:MAG: HD domain-containing protein [Thermodesulfobacteriota bacterium]
MPRSWSKKPADPASAARGEGHTVPFPSRPECLALMAEYGMLPHIREHSFLVAAVALHLGRALVETGFDLHLDLLEAGALLHDLGKTPCLGTSQNHAEWGAALLLARDYPEVARIVKEHVALAENHADPRSLREVELVNYADKRVLHTRVVTLQERFADLKVRYGRGPEALARLSALEVKAQALEARIFQPLALTPADLLYLNHSWRDL